MEPLLIDELVCKDVRLSVADAAAVEAFRCAAFDRQAALSAQPDIPQIISCFTYQFTYQ